MDFALKGILEPIKEEMRIWLTRQQTLILERKNVFGVHCSDNEWSKFISSSKFDTYKDVIEQYVERYNKLLYSSKKDKFE